MCIMNIFVNFSYGENSPTLKLEFEEQQVVRIAHNSEIGTRVCLVELPIPKLRWPLRPFWKDGGNVEHPQSLYPIKFCFLQCTKRLIYCLLAQLHGKCCKPLSSMHLSFFYGQLSQTVERNFDCDISLC